MEALQSLEAAGIMKFEQKGWSALAPLRQWSDMYYSYNVPLAPPQHQACKDCFAKNGYL